jgi:hypothetical protein
MLAEHREFEVAGLVRVIAVDHQPVVAFASRPRQGADRVDDLLSSGVGELAGDEVVEHVQYEQGGRHFGTLLSDPPLA